MCEVATIAAITTAVASAVKIGTDIAAGEVEKQSLSQQTDFQVQEIQYAEDMAKKNEKLAMMQRADVLQQGATQAGRVRAQGRRAAEDAKAQVAASGISLTEGSVPNLFTVSRVNAELDAQAIKSQAARSAWGYQQEADQLAGQQEMLRKRARYAREAGVLGRLGIDLGTAGRTTANVAQGIQSMYGAAG